MTNERVNLRTFEQSTNENKMERTTIDFGIDLGTTNSAIAVLDGVTPQIVKNNED